MSYRCSSKSKKEESRRRLLEMCDMMMVNFAHTHTRSIFLPKTRTATRATHNNKHLFDFVITSSKTRRCTATTTTKVVFYFFFINRCHRKKRRAARDYHHHTYRPHHRNKTTTTTTTHNVT